MATRFYSSAEYGSAGYRNNNDPDCLYFTTDIINNNTADPVGEYPDPQTVSTQSRQYPLLQDCTDYMVSVVRMTTNGATRNLPLWIPRIQPSTITAEFSGFIDGTLLTITGAVAGTIGPGTQIYGQGTIVSPTLGAVQGTVVVNNNGTPITILSANPVIPGKPLTYNLTAPVAYNTGGVDYFNVNVQNASFYVGNPQNDVDLTVYSVTVNGYQVYLRWIPENQYASPPSTPVQDQQITNEYYYGYTYDNILLMMNIALQQATTDAGLGGNPPYFQWRRPTNDTAGNQIIGIATGPPLFELMVPDGIEVAFNSNTLSLFPNFPVRYINQPNGRTAVFPVVGVYPDIGTRIYVQNYAGVSGWSPVDALVVTTSFLPIVQEQVTPPGYVGNSNTLATVGVQPAAFQAVIADVVQTGPNGAEDWRQDIVYEPQGEYRMVSLTSNGGPIQNIDFQVWWRSRLDNNLYPLRLENGTSVSLKLLFRRKQLGV